MTPGSKRPGSGAPTPRLAPLPCACANLRRATRAVSQLYAQEVQRGGFQGTQFTLLSVLAAVGEVPQGRLAELLAVDTTTLTRTLAPLRRRGWIEAAPGRDRRQRWLRLTPAGRRRHQRGRPHWERAQARLKRALGEEDWSALLGLMPRVTKAALEASRGMQ